MATLPHYTQTQAHRYYDEPIRLNYCEVNFGDEFKKYTEYCYKIKDDIIYFNVNYRTKTGKVDIMDFVQNTDKIKVVEIKHHDKEGKVVSITIIENFYFKEIINLLDFDWRKIDVKKIKVKFGYDKATFFDEHSYKQYIRKLKLDNIESI